jgi:N-acetylglucosamine kinase-like BadF-type ATPase
MTHYVIGVDGGGTKTELALIDLEGNLVGMEKVGSTNYQAVGGEQLRDELLEGFSGLANVTNVDIDRVDHIFLGLAGAGRQTDQEEIKALFEDTVFAGKITVDSDAIVALAGAFGTNPGIILIAGTGAICFGSNQDGKIVRSGGWGYLLGDEGSGYYIGREAIIASLKDFDGRGEKTSLKENLKQRFELDSIDKIIPRIYQNKIDRVAIANIAPVVFELANQGDLIAEEIVRKTGHEMGLLAKSVATQLKFSGEEINVALIGSIFKQKDMLVSQISKELFEISWNVTIVEPRFQPAFGAALLGLKKKHVNVNETVLSNLEMSIRNYVEQ